MKTTRIEGTFSTNRTGYRYKAIDLPSTYLIAEKNENNDEEIVQIKWSTTLLLYTLNSTK